MTPRRDKPHLHLSNNHIDGRYPHEKPSSISSKSFASRRANETPILRARSHDHSPLDQTQNSHETREETIETLPRHPSRTHASHTARPIPVSRRFMSRPKAGVSSEVFRPPSPFHDLRTVNYDSYPTNPTSICINSIKLGSDFHETKDASSATRLDNDARASPARALRRTDGRNGRRFGVRRFRFVRVVPQSYARRTRRKGHRLIIDAFETAFV